MKAQKSGLDIAHYQSEPRTVDFKQMADAMTADGIANLFACKATQGTNYLDPFFNTNRTGSMTLPCDCRLYYHFLNWKPGTPISDAIAQADFCLSKIGTLAPSQGIMLDAEQFVPVGVDPVAWYREEAVFSAAWADHVEQKIQRPIMLYSVLQMWLTAALNNGTRGLLAAWWPGSVVTDAANADDQVRAKTARYRGTTPLAGWQWISHGTFPGVFEVVDLDMILDPSFFRAAGGSVTPIPPPVPSIPALHGHQTVRLGDNGNDVLVLQHELNRLNYNTQEDGIFDRELEDKVRWYQTTRKLSVDGVCGVKETWPALLSNKPAA